MTLILIDAKNAMYRFGYTARNLTTEDGKPTGAVYGILACLLRLKKKYDDAKFVVVWEGKNSNKSWRHALYAGYKDRSGRESKPDDIHALVTQQLDVTRTLLGYLGIPQAMVDNTEADDLISLIACGAKGIADRRVIYSSDRDYLQLMQYGVEVIRGVDKEDKLRVETKADVEREFRCSLENVTKVRAITGDSSDKIPGVIKGVGVVGAAKLIAAGVRPELEDWRNHPWVVRNNCFLGPVWNEVHRNYKLMLLPTAILDDRHGSGVEQELRRVLYIVAGKVVQPVRRVQALELMGELELVEAVSKRHELFALQT